MASNHYTELAFRAGEKRPASEGETQYSHPCENAVLSAVLTVIEVILEGPGPHKQMKIASTGSENDEFQALLVSDETTVEDEIMLYRSECCTFGRDDIN